MRRITLLIFIFSFAAILFFCRSLHAVCIFSEPAFSSVPAGSDIRLTKEIKYTSGKDGLWFTADDAIYDYSLYRYDHSGKVLEKVCYITETIGKGKNEIVSKKGVSEYLRLEHDSQGRVVKEVFYTGPGPDNQWFTADDAIYATKQCFYGQDGLQSLTRKYQGSGPDNQWFTADDELQYYILYFYSDVSRVNS